MTLVGEGGLSTHYDRSMRAATLAENAIISVLGGQYRRSTYLRKAHKHSRNDGVIGAAVWAVLADFILEGYYEDHHGEMRWKNEIMWFWAQRALRKKANCITGCVKI